MMVRSEAIERFPCFGSECAVYVLGEGAHHPPHVAARAAKRRLLSWHERFSRFDPASELSQLNADPRPDVPVSTLMARLAEVILEAARATDGLVDSTLVAEITAAGYDGDLRTSLPLGLALRLAPPRAAAARRANPAWETVSVDFLAGVVHRPPGVMLDSGGVAKGLFADLLSDVLATHASFAIDCGGDMRLGGTAGVRRPVDVAGPFGGPPLHTFALAAGGVATSGIGRRSWLDHRGRPAHHLLDPATGRPAFTGIVQATAAAPTALEAEIRSKAALLSGPESAHRWLPDGGVLVFDDATHQILDPR
jgi:thiamine biosynthesis lipoprotein